VCFLVVTFEHEKLHSCESSQPLDFTILVKKTGSQEMIFGEATFDWTKFLTTDSPKCDVSLIVKTKSIVLGKMKIKVQVGDENHVAAKSHSAPPERHDVRHENSLEAPEPVVVPIVEEPQKKSPPSNATNKVLKNQIK
jgi:hypothetical protein